MKLIGSKTEQEFREQLIQSKKSLFSGEDRRNLREVISKFYPQMKTAYVLDWIPEQGEDLYKILINDDIIGKIELRCSNVDEPIVESLTVSQYLHSLSKRNQIQLAVALDLAQRDIGNM